MMLPPVKKGTTSIRVNSSLQLKEKEYWVRVDENGEQIGEAVPVDVLVKQIPRTGFFISYLSQIISMIDSIGNKKMKVVKYILRKMDSNNLLTETTREIAERSGISKQTVIETLKLLEKSGIIARKTGVIMLSPKLFHKGSYQRECYLMTKFLAIDSEETEN